jgi:protein subunit release factor B
MGLHMGIPIFLPTIALITKLALEWLHTEMFVHVLAKISSFKKTFFTSAMKFNYPTRSSLKQDSKNSEYS